MAEIISLEDYKWEKMGHPDVDARGFYSCMGVTEDCVNPGSFGVICVHCNGCGRFTED